MSSSEKSLNLACIVPTHNRKRELNVLLHQISEQKNVFGLILDIIVVVDGSTDGTLEMLRGTYPDVHIVEGDGSWWYTKSMNEGFSYAMTYFQPDLILAMNDDTEVGVHYINNLLDAYCKVEKGSIVGSVSFTKTKPHKIITSGSYYRNNVLGLSSPYIPFFSEIDVNELGDKILSSNFLPGRGMLIPIDTLKELEKFDEKFMQYHSDNDFCLRARRKGYKVYIAWGARIKVYEKLTGGGTSYLYQSVQDYLKTFFDPSSRNYIPSIARFKWRHLSKLLWPLNMFIFFTVSCKNYLFKSKI